MKTYRVYFNRELDFPQAWSVDEGTQESEINIVGFQIIGADSFSKVLSADERAGLDGKRTPVAWLQVYGELTLKAGMAIFTRGQHG